MPDKRGFLTKADVIAMIEPLGGTWEDFGKWIFGQTVPYDRETNETSYYPWDVQRFVMGLQRGKTIEQQIRDIED